MEVDTHTRTHSRAGNTAEMMMVQDVSHLYLEYSSPVCFQIISCVFSSQYRTLNGILIGNLDIYVHLQSHCHIQPAFFFCPERLFLARSSQFQCFNIDWSLFVDFTREKIDFFLRASLHWKCASAQNKNIILIFVMQLFGISENLSSCYKVAVPEIVVKIINRLRWITNYLVFKSGMMNSWQESCKNKTKILQNQTKTIESKEIDRSVALHCIATGAVWVAAARMHWHIVDIYFCVSKFVGFSYARCQIVCSTCFRFRESALRKINTNDRAKRLILNWAGWMAGWLRGTIYLPYMRSMSSAELKSSMLF